MHETQIRLRLGTLQADLKAVSKREQALEGRVELHGVHLERLESEEIAGLKDRVKSLESKLNEAIDVLRKVLEAEPDPERSLEYACGTYDRSQWRTIPLTIDPLELDD